MDDAAARQGVPPGDAHDTRFPEALAQDALDAMDRRFLAHLGKRGSRAMCAREAVHRTALTQHKNPARWRGIFGQLIWVKATLFFASNSLSMNRRSRSVSL